MTAVPDDEDELLAVWDSFYGESRILAIDTSESPAAVTDNDGVDDRSGESWFLGLGWAGDLFH